MTIEIFTLCDDASTEDGTITIHRTFDAWRATQFPSKIPPFFAVARIRVPEDYPGGECQFGIVNPDGRSKFSPPAKFEGPVANLLFKNRNIIVSSPGIYYAELSLDGKTIAKIPMSVRMRSQPKLSTSRHMN